MLADARRADYSVSRSTLANMSLPRVKLSVGIAALLAASGCFAQRIDPGIGRQIATIQAIDNHAHPVLAPPLDTSDQDFDALPVSSLEPQSDPVALRPEFTLLGAAWKALYGFTVPPPLDAQGLKQLNEARKRISQQQGEHFPAWVLEQAGIGTMLANRVAMGSGVQPPQFRWVPYIDALLFPLDNTGMAAASPDRKEFFALESIVRSRYLQEAALSAPPSTLDKYLTQVVTATLERHKLGGAVAEKYEVAYLRSFDFSDPSRADAEQIYARWVAGGQPDPAGYKLLQDFLFRYIATECGRLGLAVHLHALGGFGSYYSISGGNPLLLEPLFNDPRLRKTNFVLLHGGWPFVREMGALLEAERLCGHFLPVAHHDSAYASTVVARVAGDCPRKSAIRNRRVSLFRRIGLAGGDLDCKSQCAPGTGHCADGNARRP